MKKGLNVNELAIELDRQNRLKRDFCGDTTTMKLEPGDEAGEILLHGLRQKGELQEPMPLLNTAHAQFAERLKIPKPYYDRMREESPDLLTHNCNHWLTNSPNQRIVRTMDNRVRAFLSNRYRMLDNAEFAAAILPVVAELGAEVRSSQITDSRMYIKVVMPSLCRQILKPGTEMGKGHDTYYEVMAAIVLGNSEIGQGRLFCDSGIYTTGCTNLAIRKSSGYQKNHLGRAIQGEDGLDQWMSDDTRRQADKALFAQVGDLARASLDGRMFEQQVREIEVAKGIELSHPAKACEEIGRRYQMTEEETGGILEHLMKGGDLTRYGLSSAVTRAAQDVPSYDRSTEMECTGGDIITLNESQWQTIDTEAAAK